MSFYGKFVTAAIAAALTGGAALPGSSTSAPTPAPVAPPAAVEADPAPILVPQMPAPAAPTAPATEAPEAPEPRRTASTAMDSELECLAKVILREAGSESRTGQIAVAEVVMNRLKSPRFPNTICGVALQRGQFFNVHAYHPQRDRRWPRAVEIARMVRDGQADSVTNGALFFRAHYGAPFRGRTRVATIGGHAFYR